MPRRRLASPRLSHSEWRAVPIGLTPQIMLKTGESYTLLALPPAADKGDEALKRFARPLPEAFQPRKFEVERRALETVFEPCL